MFECMYVCIKWCNMNCADSIFSSSTMNLGTYHVYAVVYIHIFHLTKRPSSVCMYEIFLGGKELSKMVVLINHTSSDPRSLPRERGDV